METLSQTKEQILRHLATYKYLTVSQLLQDLKVQLSPQKCRQYLNEMRTRQSLTGRMACSAVPQGVNKQSMVRRVRHEDLHYLTNKGAEFLDDSTELSLPDIRFARKLKTTLSNDYFHRISTVSINISFDKWVRKHGFHPLCFLVYYDKRGIVKENEDFKAETRLDFDDGRHYTPDVICAFDKDGEPFLFVLEVYHGNRTTYAFEQLKKLFLIIEHHTQKIAEKARVSKTPRVLCVFDNDTLLENVRSKVKADSFFAREGLQELLYFNRDNQVWEDFGKDWQKMNGEKLDLSTIQKVKF